MSDNIRDTAWGKAVEYGRHVFGVFPFDGDQMVTGLLAHDGEYYQSYVDDGSFKSYQNWRQDYTKTPLKDALEAFVEGHEMKTTGVAINREFYPEKSIESAGMDDWRFEYERKRAFKNAVLRGEVDLGVIALFNSYHEIFCPPDEAEGVREKYWEFIGENYEHQQSHYEATNTQCTGVN
jgi:hypothetical protein